MEWAVTAETLRAVRADDGSFRANNQRSSSNPFFARVASMPLRIALMVGASA
jgi:hypothetical protein